MKRIASIAGIAIVASLAVAMTPDRSTAPTFSLMSAEGKKVSLEDFKGKYVVLEWWNHQCPVVVDHYNKGSIQKQQQLMKDKGVVWLSICSSAPGKQGHVEGSAAADVMKNVKGVPQSVLLDPTGEVGKLYGARTTPHTFLISPKGEILYNGAIDNNRSGREATTINYVVQAFEEASAGKEVSVPKTQPYGCGVKYRN